MAHRQTRRPIAESVLRRLMAFDDAFLGPHAATLLVDLRGAARVGLPLPVIVLAAALLDVVQHEAAGPAGYLDGAAFVFAGGKADLAWLRGRRNHILHHEGPSDGLMGEAGADAWLAGDAERAITIMLAFLEDLG
jgi:hypothetical protein